MIYDKINYKIDSPYIIGTIREYDLSQANINALLYTGKIDRNHYEFLKSIPKINREICVGNMIKVDNSLYQEGIKKGIIEAKRLFFEKNNIQDNEVVAINNDAVFILGSRAIDQNPNDLFYFKCKNVFNIYARLWKYIVYYGIDNNGYESFDVKGISDEMYQLLESWIMFLCDIFRLAIVGEIKEAIDIVSDFYDKYVNKQLPIEYYREFNHTASYRINTRYGEYYATDTVDMSIINISFNINILRDLYGILMDMSLHK